MPIYSASALLPQGESLPMFCSILRPVNRGVRWGYLKVARSVKDRREMASSWLLVMAQAHQRHRFDCPHPLTQAPAKQARLSCRQQKRDRLGTHGCGSQDQRAHVLLGLSNAVIHDPECCRREVTSHPTLSLDHKGCEQADRGSKLAGPSDAV